VTSYTAIIEFSDKPSRIECECFDCDWKGTAADLKDIGSAVLTPGDPSPAGRCPECEELVYLKE